MLPRTNRHAFFVLISCLAALSCAGTLQPPAEAVPLNAEQLLLRAAEILRAEDLRVKDESLLSAIEEQSPELRAMAARSMGRIGEPSFRPLLEKSLRDREALVRAEAAFALGLIGDSAALPALSRAADDALPAVRTRVASALGLLHDPASERTIISLLGDPEPEVVAAACYSLLLFEKPAFALEPLLTLLDERGGEVGMVALRALAWIASDPALLGFDERKIVRERLVVFADSRLSEARNLAALGLAMPVMIEEADLLGRLAEEDPDPTVRFNAIRSLSFPGAPVAPFVSKALKDKNDLVVLAAVQGLGRMKGPDAIESLAWLVIHDSRLWLRKLAIAMSGKVSANRAAAMANGLSKDAEPELREAAARLLQGRTDQQSLSIAAQLLDDDDIRVRAAAIPVLAAGEGKLSESLGETLHDGEHLIRMAVADAAGRRLADPARSAEEKQEALSIIHQLWKSATEPADAGVRLAAKDAAARGGAELPESDISEADPPLADYVEILRWAEKPRAAVITVERPGFIPGMFTIKLDTTATPLTAWRFARLAEEGYYDGQEVNRLVPGLLVQSGGNGVQQQTVLPEISPSSFDPGTLGMVSNGQWFISLATQPLRSPGHTAFGRVVQNFPGVVSLLLPDDRIVSVRVYEGDGSEELEQP
jgi:HEAT repeat protein/cyclophilin family peptidyl-prolyl cis-trans isomerase